MPTRQIENFPDACLRDFSARVFKHFGVPKRTPNRPPTSWREAICAASTPTASRGCIPISKCSSWAESIRDPKIKIVREKASVATVDGDNGLGLVVGPEGQRDRDGQSRAAGSGWVSVCNTNHFGIAGYYPLQALERDLIGWAMTNTTKLVAPLWGAERMLGTNPIAIAFPG